MTEQGLQVILPIMKTPSIIAAGRKHFKLSLANKKADFPEKSCAIVQQRHPEWPSPSQWAFGGSLLGAKLMIDLIPKKHVRTSQMRYANNDKLLLAEVTEISPEAFRAVSAFELCHGEVFEGNVRLEATEPFPSSPHDKSTRALFARLLANQPVHFPHNNTLLVSQLDAVYRFPTSWTLGKSLEDAKRIASLLPSEHVQHRKLVVSESKLELAHVVFVSGAATSALVAWHECKRTKDIKCIMKRMAQISKAIT